MKSAIAVFSALGILLSTAAFAEENLEPDSSEEAVVVELDSSDQATAVEFENSRLEESQESQELELEEKNQKSPDDQLYRVYQGDIHLANWSFSSKEAAILEALKWGNSHILHSGEKVWSYGDQLYRVYQGSTHLAEWSFASKEAAIQEALKWRNSHIVQNRERVWSYGDQMYKVYQGNTHLDNWTFKSREEAIAEALKWKNSHVLRNGTIIWREVDSKNESKPVYIAHGGGEYEGFKISNSKEAILSSLSKGVEHIEIDFVLTDDNEYVLLHDWGNFQAWTGTTLKYKTKEEFKKASEKAGFTALDLDELVELMREYPQFKVVTDIKSGNKEFLSELKRKYPDLSNRFIPQIYEEEQYSWARKLGFGDIIYSLYQVWRSDSEVIEFAKENNLFAVTMAKERTFSGLPKHLSKLGIMTYCHTINTIEEMESCRENGIAGIYTDSLLGLKR
ncbi:glycerophosphoryl diester phosphodiesterase family protein [Andreesenia angusta]|uniref:Glycerophosphoryl diester phosphodiesterase family protein n=1 Tax=Andreesenia angusta TaxID=39480 RepID=A0A1S1V987_9FIRM|nr:hypothetical protein [Andreesenia angusta]OHW63158.1 glycerophosphoryl diester phosphodiesterase family protein [Andreesenia angusta]